MLPRGPYGQLLRPTFDGWAPHGDPTALRADSELTVITAPNIVGVPGVIVIPLPWAAARIDCVVK